MKKKSFIIVAVAMGAFLISASMIHAATHYVQGYSAVDGREIRWGGSTKYSNQWNKAIDTWNALGKINITPDTFWTIEDVRVIDINRSDGKWAVWAGGYEYSTRSVYLNEYNLAGDNSYEIQNTTTHELGHALGLDHHPLYGNIMYEEQTDKTYLGLQDKGDYAYLYP